MSERTPLRPPLAAPDTPPVTEASDAAASRVPGLAMSFAVAVAATVIGKLVPIVGSPIPGIVIGALLAVVVKPGRRLRPGMGSASKTVLQMSVVVLGCNLSLRQIARAGTESLPVLFGTLVVCLAAAFAFGRRLKISGRLTTLIGVGTGICGASAIAAVTPVIGAVGAEVAYAVSTIFVFNIAAVIVFPVVGHMLGLSQHSFGLFAGTAVNDTSSVVAAATTYGNAAGSYAVVVKLTRTLCIIPVCLTLAALEQRRARREGTVAQDAKRVRVWSLVPWFLVGFLLTATANTLGLIPDAAHPVFGETSAFLITVALSAIGLSTDIPSMRRAGSRPVLLGGILWVVVSGTSLVLQVLTGSL
ncbi:YeiH family protein [Streptomyces sp. NPDC048282]|uniref:YeiH family protein n=1 Tax=unclassified Streptomyces TaxID=2593676 RepID=UPI0037186646